MSSTDFGEDLSRSNLPLELIAKLMTQAQQNNIPLEEDIVIDYCTMSPLQDIHNITTTIGQVDAEPQETAEHLASTAMFRRVPESPFPYDLVHTLNGSGLTFPTADRKHGARVDFDGSSYITIGHNSTIMDVTAKGWNLFLHLPATESGDALQYIFRKGTAYSLHVRAHSDAANTLRYTAVHGGSSVTFDYTYTPGTWFHVGIKDDAGSQEIWIDETSEDTDTVAGASDTNTTDFSIGADAGGSNPIKSGSRMAWFSWFNYALTKSLSDGHNNGILDTNTAKEITTIPFWGNVNPQPDATPGIFVAGS